MLLIAASAVAAQELPQVSDIIQNEGQFAFTDSASYYLFRSDGRFESGPLGLSGRTIAGHWKLRRDRAFEIEGKWGWVNGLSPRDDFRRMTLSLSGPSDPTEPKDLSPVSPPEFFKVYKCYFVIDELVKIPKPEAGRQP